MKLAVLRETFPGERRVAIVPTSVKPLVKAGLEVFIESGAGESAGFNDASYQSEGASIASRDVCLQSEIIVQVRALGCNREVAEAELSQMRSGQVLIATCDPMGEAEYLNKAAQAGVDVLALELIPRITRAQSMDVLSSMACVAGYRAALQAAVELPKMFPLMMTAAGTLKPARVFVIGAGVAGLQAIATSRRMGAVVQAYDVRPAVGEQVESLGAKFVQLELESKDAEDKGGYAKAMGEEFYERQRQLMASVIAESDIVITTAAIPGKPSPLLITEEAVIGMPDGGVIIDMAAERGGNCALSKPDQRVVKHNITILGPTNLPSEAPYHASQMFSKNVQTLVLHLLDKGSIRFDLSDEITAGTLATHQSVVIHPIVRNLLGMEPLPKATPDTESSTTQKTS
jgi:H+-translocating NAD(P) transhydrogenase subunit alpha